MSGADSNQAFQDFMKTIMAVIIFAIIVGALFWALVNALANNSVPIIAILPIALAVAVLALAYKYNVLQKHGKRIISYIIFISFLLSAIMIINTSQNVSATTLVFSDDFEGGNTGWTLGGSADITTWHSHSPTHGLQIGTPSDTAYRSTTLNYPCSVDFWFYHPDSPGSTLDLIRFYDSAWGITGAGIYYDMSNNLYSQDYNNGTHTDLIASSVPDNSWNHIVLSMTDSYHFNVVLNGVDKGDHFGNPGGDIGKIYVGQVDGSYANIVFDDFIVSNTANVVTWKPTFLNSPSIISGLNATYYYNAQLNESCTITMDIKPSWTTLSGHNISGVPDTIGVKQFSMKAISTNGTLSAWKNWSVVITNAGVVSSFNYEPFNNLTQWTYVADINHCEIVNTTYISAPNCLRIAVGSGSYYISKIFNPELSYPLIASINFKVNATTVSDLFNFHPLEVNGHTCGIYHDNGNNTFQFWNWDTGTNYTYICPITNPYDWNSLSYYFPDAYHIFYTLNGVVLKGTNLDGSYNQTPNGGHESSVGSIEIEANEPTGWVYFDDLSLGALNYTPPTPVAPYFTSSPVISVYTNSTYEYDVTTNTTSFITASSLPGWLILSNDSQMVSDHNLTSIILSPSTPGSFNVELKAWITIGYYAYQNFTIVVSYQSIPPPVTYGIYITGAFDKAKVYWYENDNLTGVLEYLGNYSPVKNAIINITIQYPNFTTLKQFNVTTDQNGIWNCSTIMNDIRASGTNINNTYHARFYAPVQGNLNASNTMIKNIQIIPIPIPRSFNMGWILILLAILMFPLGLLLRRMKKLPKR